MYCFLESQNKQRMIPHDPDEDVLHSDHLASGLLSTVWHFCAPWRSRQWTKSRRLNSYVSNIINRMVSLKEMQRVD